MTGDTILLAALVFHLYGVGMCWTLQLNHYPLYGFIPEDGRGLYITAHNRRLFGPVILPSTLAFVFSIALCWLRPPTAPLPVVGVVITLDLIILLSTFLVLAPAHGRLARGENGSDAIDGIVRANWVRTICWTASGLILCWLTSIPTSGG